MRLSSDSSASDDSESSSDSASSCSASSDSSDSFDDSSSEEEKVKVWSVVVGRPVFGESSLGTRVMSNTRAGGDLIDNVSRISSELSEEEELISESREVRYVALAINPSPVSSKFIVNLNKSLRYLQLVGLK